jgi:prefoldin subunit 5
MEQKKILLFEHPDPSTHTNFYRIGTAINQHEERLDTLTQAVKKLMKHTKVLHQRINELQQEADKK